MGYSGSFFLYKNVDLGRLQSFAIKVYVDSNNLTQSIVFDNINIFYKVSKKPKNIDQSLIIEALSS